MRLSTDRILTTHVGSLPRAPDLYARLQAKEAGAGGDDALEAMVSASVHDVVARQLAIGIDIVDDGEHSKSSWNNYVGRRLAGFTPIEAAFGHSGRTRDNLAFAAVYEELRTMYAARPLRQAMPRRRTVFACTGPVRYVGHADVQADIERLRAALARQPGTEAFITALSPSNVALYYPNRYYARDEDYHVALAEAMREEYRAIVAAGFLVQIDDPRLATHWDRHPDIGIDDCRRFIAAQVEIINHALAGIPADRVRFHTCYSTNVAPRAHDLELRHYVDLMLGINACGYSFEAANPRHEHEWQVWQEVALPPDKLLLPGVVSHCVQLVEHPELVAQRIARFAGVVGRERVIASNDCGFASSGAGDEVHPDVAWAKLAALVEGARIATQRLWGGVS
jgi:5-methyltetrahydropteroyltriglutamate--homocysteine methyltransferase